MPNGCRCSKDDREANCGSNADCVDLPSGGHECVCHTGYHNSQIAGRIDQICVPDDPAAANVAESTGMGAIRVSHVYVDPLVDEAGTKIIGGMRYTRYLLRVHLNASAHNIYTIFGHRMVWPYSLMSPQLDC
eukprot:SAG31_NODE_595_length_13695_cov_11.446896_8_plen_132_part_00